MAHKGDLSPSDQSREVTSFKDRFGVKLATGILAVSTAFGLSACSSENVNAKPEPVETTSSAPVTPGPVETTAPTTPVETPTPSTTETTGSNIDIQPVREWKISPDTLSKLEATKGDDKAQWAILKQLIEDNNPGAGYYGKYGRPENGDIIQNNTRPPEELAERTFIELATMADLGKDSTVPDGLKIAEVWAELAFINDPEKNAFLGSAESLRGDLVGPDSKEALELDKKKPLNHFSKTVYDGGINNFNYDGTEYTGTTFLILRELHNLPNSRPVTVDQSSFRILTVVFNDATMSTRILRLEGLQGDNPTANFQPGIPTNINDLPEYQAELGKQPK